MTMTHDEALAAVTAPGTLFELAVADGGTRHADPVFVNAPTSLREVYREARAHADSTFLVHGRGRLSFAETLDSADAFAAALATRYGVVAGDRVAIAMRNLPEWVMSFVGATSIGAVCVPLNSWWTGDELAYAIADAAPRVIVADAQRASLVEEIARRQHSAVITVRAEQSAADHDRWDDVVKPAGLPDAHVRADDDATILYTSGTTGHPKGAVSTHRAVVQALWGISAQEAVEAVKLGDDFPSSSSTPGALLGVPLFHVTGCVAVMLNALRGGQKLVMMHRWDAATALRLIEEEALTAVIGVPTQCFDLMNHPQSTAHDLSSLQWLGGGGAATPPALLTQLREQLPHVAPSFGYGMTETNALGPAICCDEAFAHPESVGPSAPSMRVEIRDPETADPVPAGGRGEIWLRGPSLIRGYWNRPDADLFHDGWLRTGDLGHLDDAGRIYIDDRLKDMVVRGGENIYCAEVEATLYEHPAVLEAAVFGVPDRRLGEQVAAAVVLRPDSSADGARLSSFLAERLAAYKIPAWIHVRAEGLPRTASGKFHKVTLREEWEAHHARV